MKPPVLCARAGCENMLTPAQMRNRCKYCSLSCASRVNQSGEKRRARQQSLAPQLRVLPTLPVHGCVEDLGMDGKIHYWSDGRYVYHQAPGWSKPRMAEWTRAQWETSAPYRRMHAPKPPPVAPEPEPTPEAKQRRRKGVTFVARKRGAR